MKVKSLPSVGLTLAVTFATVTVFAADSHDYASYYQYVGTTTVSGGRPAADDWNPREETMSSEHSYFVPSTKTLTSSTSNGAQGGEWPSKEFAVQGRLKISVSSNVANAPTFSGLAVCAGGSIYLPSVNSGINGDTIEMRGTRESPARIYSDQEFAGGSTKYPVVNPALICFDADAVGVLEHTVAADDGDDLKHGFYLGGVRDYSGTLVVKGAHTWARPKSSTSTFDLDGTLELADGGNFMAIGVNPTIGNLIVGGGSTFEIAQGCLAFVTKSLQVAEGGKIRVANTFGEWEVGVSSVPVKFLTFGPDVERPDDYGEIVEVVPPANAKGGLPSLVFSENELPDGSVEVSVAYREIVQIKATSSGRTPCSPTRPDYSMLTDYQEGGENGISPQKDYYTENTLVCQDGAYVFPGHSLTVAARLSSYGCEFSCGNLYLVSGGAITQPNWGNTTTVAGKLHFKGGSVVIGTNKTTERGVSLLCDIDGSSDMQVARGGSGDDNPEVPAALVLGGDNRAFSGKILMAAGNSILRVKTRDSLGGPLAEPAADGVSIGDKGTLELDFDADAVVADVTRGWMFGGTSVLSTGASSIKVLAPVTIAEAGTLTKKGAKNLSVASVRGNALVLSEGTLSAATSNAFVGLSSLTFAEGTAFVVDASETDVGLRASGADFSTTALTVPVGGTAVEFASIPEDGCSCAVATFATASEADKFVLKRPRGYTVRRAVEQTGDKFLLRATIEKSGLVLIFR